ncbi:MAG TPA: nicotinamide-nucleotide adenylyltransferase [Candidatus Nanopelagicaceae bacterium]|nr:nicotinamide-nucleotide adenylyltransferase [Candidatus Nanopelagicaceae bacterium]
MDEEVIACITDENIKFLHSGQIEKYVFPMNRGEAHKKGISHLIIRLFVITVTPNNQIYYLVQKRGKMKKSFPEYYTDSASGHVLYKKNLNLYDIQEEAKRELAEEFGILPKHLEKILFYDLISEEDKGTTEIAYVFLGLVNHDVELKPNPNELEVGSSRYYTKSELSAILKNENSVDYSKDIWNKLFLVDLDEFLGLNTRKNKKISSKKDVALFLGRFQPLHHGHIYMLNKILKIYKTIKIGVGSSQFSKTKINPFTYEERVNFITSTLNKRGITSQRFSIYPIPDIFNASKWVNHVISIVGNFDTIFSNSDWVRQLFQNEGHIVGEKIEIFKKKYNASNVRKLIYKDNRNWTTLVPKEVVNLIKDYEGIERIRNLFNKVDSA